MQRTPPIDQISTKRNLAEISPEIPGSKRQVLGDSEMDKEKLTDMSVRDFRVLFSQMFEDLSSGFLKKISLLETQNKELTSTVHALSTKVELLESQMQSMYSWRNGGNLIMKLNRSDDSADRVYRTCNQLAGETNSVEKTAIKEIRTADRKKITFKIFTGDAVKVSKMLKNCSTLRGTDISVTKDYPKEVREQQQNLLKVRRFLMKKSNAKPKVRGNLLFIDDIRMNWSTSQGLVVTTGEPLSNVLSKYGQTTEDLKLFLSQQPNNMNRGGAGNSNAGAGLV